MQQREVSSEKFRDSWDQAPCESLSLDWARSFVFKPFFLFSVSGKARAKIRKVGREDPILGGSGLCDSYVPGVLSPRCSLPSLLLEATVTFSVSYRIAAHRRAMGLWNPRDQGALRLLLEARRS